MFITKLVIFFKRSRFTEKHIVKKLHIMISFVLIEDAMVYEFPHTKFNPKVNVKMKSETS